MPIQVTIESYYKVDTSISYIIQIHNENGRRMLCFQPFYLSIHVRYFFNPLRCITLVEIIMYPMRFSILNNHPVLNINPGFFFSFKLSNFCLTQQYDIIFDMDYASSIKKADGQLLTIRRGLPSSSNFKPPAQYGTLLPAIPLYDRQNT